MVPFLPNLNNTLQCFIMQNYNNLVIVYKLQRCCYVYNKIISIPTNIRKKKKKIMRKYACFSIVFNISIFEKPQHPCLCVF